MKEKWISSVMAGIFIAMGAMVYLSIPNTIVASLFFSTGILLVLNLHNMLLTRVWPMTVYNGSYRLSDSVIAWVGNGIGTILVAVLIHFTRFEKGILEKIEGIGKMKLSDDPASLIILGVFCAMFVAFAVFVGGVKQKNGSFAQIFYVWLFITAFVFCGFEHIIADMYYLSVYILNFGALPMDVAKVLICVTVGNLIGGGFVGYAVRKLEEHQQ